jgi:hypothetical protein
MRALERGDHEQWRLLRRAYLDFYGVVETAEVTGAVWSRIFDPLESVRAVVAVRAAGLGVFRRAKLTP